MVIKGLQKLTLLDFPDRVACTVFLGGCNLRCPFCHNASLVLPGRDNATVSEDEFFGHLEARRGRITGVCVSGGEPTLQSGLVDFISKIKAMGFAVKLDTNGTRPGVLVELLSAGLLDYVAMDIKNSRESYGVTVGIADFDITPIEESLRLLRESGIDYELRTTLARELHSTDDIRSIGEWLRGEKKYYLQTFIDSGDIIGSDLSAYSREESEALLALLREYIPAAELRG